MNQIGRAVQPEKEAATRRLPFKRMSKALILPLCATQDVPKRCRATMTVAGVIVDDLGTQSLLPWIVFEEAINVLKRNGGRASKGDAMAYKLGEPGLSLESVEGHIAHVIYGKQIGDSVFRRISPISAILVWVGLCDTAPGDLILR